MLPAYGSMYKDGNSRASGLLLKESRVVCGFLNCSMRHLSHERWLKKVGLDQALADHHIRCCRATKPRRQPKPAGKYPGTCGRRASIRQNCGVGYCQLRTPEDRAANILPFEKWLHGLSNFLSCMTDTIQPPTASHSFCSGSRY